MRPFIALFLSFFLALPAAWAGELALLCARLPAAEETTHACCQQEVPDCSAGAMSGACYCPSPMPSAPVTVPPAIAPAPSVSAALLTPELPVIEHLVGDPLSGCLALSPPAVPPSPLYQLHRAYRI
jgi:hypothetical protein